MTIENAIQSNRFPRSERLRGERRISQLFGEGESGFVYPFRYFYTIEKAAEGAEGGVAVLVSVPKRNHRRANKRNLLKRRMREAFRLGKHDLKQRASDAGVQVDISLVYSTKDILEYKTIRDAVGKIITTIGQAL